MVVGLGQSLARDGHIGDAGNGQHPQAGGTRDRRLTGAFHTVEDNIAAVCATLRLTPREGHIVKAAHINEAYIRDLLSHWKEDALPTVREIKKRGMRLGLLSDCYSTTANLWGEGPLAPHFDAAVFSCKAGACKPDARLFTMVAERLRVEPAQCLYVGDGGGDELTGAAACGMTTILVVNDRRDPHLKDSPSLACPRTVRRLSEVLVFVES